MSSPIPYRSSRWPARFLVITGIGHTIVGLALQPIREPLVQAIKDGYFNQFKGSAARCHSFWFLLAGANMILMGRFIDWYLFSNIQDNAKPEYAKVVKDKDALTRHARKAIQSDKALPRELGYWFVGLAVAGASAMPRSGFYLLGLQGLGILLSK
ncbi:hypothetical protein BGZ76_011242 [Entomortierella beljakovae]|nr:hypothetical protein BGZ76_011242 [Entomortierella beljakovae]